MRIITPKIMVMNQPVQSISQVIQNINSYDLYQQYENNNLFLWLRNTSQERENINFCEEKNYENYYAFLNSLDEDIDYHKMIDEYSTLYNQIMTMNVVDGIELYYHMKKLIVSYELIFIYKFESEKDHFLNLNYDQVIALFMVARGTHELLSNRTMNFIYKILKNYNLYNSELSLFTKKTLNYDSPTQQSSNFPQPIIITDIYGEPAQLKIKGYHAILETEESYVESMDVNPANISSVTKKLLYVRSISLLNYSTKLSYIEVPLEL